MSSASQTPDSSRARRAKGSSQRAAARGERSRGSSRASLLGRLLLALVLPAWAASLIVVGILLVIVLVLALAGKSSLQSAQKHRPDPAASVAATKEAIEKGLGK